jgi:hypothetical protein
MPAMLGDCYALGIRFDGDIGPKRSTPLLKPKADDYRATDRETV